MVSGPSDGELELLREARDAAWRAREGWLAAQVGSLGRSLADVTTDPHGQEIEAEAAAAASAYRAACHRRWPPRRRSNSPVNPRLPGL
ncbi:MAG: hypothetical protein ACYDHB_04530 [Candidatus Dormibacteria bacterium]